MEKHYGIPVSPGVVFAKAFVVESDEIVVQKTTITEDDIPREIARFEDALTKTRAELLTIRKKIATDLGREHSEIFNAHLLVLEDRTLIEEVISKLREDLFSVEYVFSAIITQYAQAFAQINDNYLKERMADIKDIGQRVIRNLLGKKKETLTDIHEKVIVIAHDLAPSDTAVMNRDYVIGFATDVGGPTSHVAIMARSLEIPAVVGLQSISRQVMNGDIVVIDGSNGTVIVNPTDKDLDKYRSEEEKFEVFVQQLNLIKDLPAQTRDGHRIELSANIEFPSDIDSVLSHGADGIGLYRTEYMYLSQADFPTEHEQFVAYKKVAKQMGDRPVIVRTLDLGGDKFATTLDMPKELNSFMGWRAIRFCLTRKDIFKTQLRAILRASHFGNLRIMFPMISNMLELREAKDIVEEVKDELRQERKKFNEDILVGIMVEIPSTAIASDVFAQEADFFSIGSNDLIQYSLAVDRGNEKVAYLYQPTHPAILHIVSKVIESGHNHKLWVGLCGEMASDPVLAVLLMGLGIDELSISAVLLPKVKKLIRSVTLEDAKKMAHQCLTFHTNEEVNLYLEKTIKNIAID